MVPIGLTREARKFEGSNSNLPPFVRGISDFPPPRVSNSLTGLTVPSVALLKCKF
jgi:hypothetical protein